MSANARIEEIGSVDQIGLADAGSKKSIDTPVPPIIPQDSFSNIESFLTAVSPVLRLQQDQEESSKRCNGQCSTSFQLSDLWDVYEDWSVYGRQVDLALNSHGVVAQYYVPYLSSLHLSIRTTKRQEHPRRGHEKDLDPESRDSSSDLSEFDYGRMAGSDSSSEIGSDSTSVADELCYGGPCRCLDCRGQHKVIEFVEKNKPNSRAPLYQTIQKMAERFPVLNSLHSTSVHPSSWYSVAWHPLYRIPSGHSLRETRASFLTFHSLSTAQISGCEQCAEQFWISPGAVQSTLGEVSPTHIEIQAFGLMGYKVNPGVWMPHERSCETFWRLGNQADKWLRQRNVFHCDYAYFKSASPVLH